MAWVDNNEYPPLTAHWADIQEKVYTRWMNTHLRRRDPPITLKMGSLYRGALSSGIILWELIDQISDEGDKPKTKCDRRGKMKIHHINNLNITYDFLSKGNPETKRQPLKFVGIGSEDIYDQKKTLVAGFVWTIILRFQVADCSIDKFIAWLNSVGIMVKNLTSDWTDGEQFAKLINILRPGYLSPEPSPFNTILKGLELAEEEFGVPQVIDADDMATHADERSNFVYLSYYKQMWDELSGPSVRLIGEPKRVISARKPCLVELKTWDITNPEIEITAVFNAPDGEVLSVPKIERVESPESADGRTGFAQFKFVPPKPGHYISSIKAGGRDMRKGPLTVVATPSPWARLTSAPDAKQGVPSILQVTIGNGLTTDDLYMEIEDAAGRTLKVPSLFSQDITDKDRFNCMFVPSISGPCKVRIFYKDDGSEIDGSGASMLIYGKPSIDWDSNGAPDRFFKGVKSTVVLQANGHTPDSLDVSVRDSDGNRIEVALEETSPGIFNVSFTPDNTGVHVFDIKADMISVPGLPRNLNVEEKPTAYFMGPTEIKAVAMKPVRFDLSVVNLKTSEVQLNFADGKGNKVDLPVKVEDNGNGTFTVEFVPTAPGHLDVQVNVFGEDIGTLNVDITDPPTIVGGSGPNNRRNARATKLFEFQLQGGNISADDIKVSIVNEKDESLPHPTVQETEPGLFTVSFVPPHPGSLKVGVWPCYADAESLYVDVAPMAQFIGDTNQVATATKPFSFNLQGAEGISVSDIGVVVKDEHGNNISEPVISDNGDGTFKVEFTPMEPGRIQVFVSTCGDTFDTPLSVKVRPCASLLEGESNTRIAHVARPFSFDVAGQKGLKAKHIAVKIDSEEGSDIATPTVKENPDGSFTVTFIPPKPDQLKVHVLSHGVPTTDLDVQVVPTCHLDADLELKGYASKPVTFNLKADAGLKTSDVHVDVKDKNGNVIPFTVTDKGDGTFEASFTPVHHGDHTVVVSSHGIPIAAPLTADIQALAQFQKGFTDSKHKAIATKPFSFDLDAVALKPEDVQIDIVNEKGEKLPNPEIKDNGDGTFTATFTPMEHGDLTIAVSTKGVAFDRKLEVEVAPIARFLGETKRATTATKVFDFQLSAPNLTPEDIVVNIEGKLGKIPQPNVVDNKDGTFNVSFTPMECDDLQITVITKGEAFDTPLEVSVAPIASFIGGTKRIGTATKPLEFSLSAKHGIKPEDVTFDIVAADGTKLPPPTITDAGNGTFTVAFTPAEPGDLKVFVSTKGVVFDTPLEVHVRPTAKFLGGGRRQATATKPFDFSLGADQLKIEDVAVSIIDEKGNKLADPTISDNNDGTFSVSFTPMEHGLLTVTVSTHGDPIGAPMEVEVAPIARFLGELNRTGHSTKPFEFSLDAPLLAPEDVTVSITNEKGYSLPPPTVTDNGDGTFLVSFIPMDPCQLAITVTTKGEELDTPLTVNVLPTAKWMTPSVIPARATVPVNLKLKAEAGLTTDDLKVLVKYDNGESVEAQVKDNGDGTITMSFIPPVEGNLEVSVTAHGDPIGDPTRVLVAGPPSAKFPPGEPLRAATQTKPFTFPLDITSVFPNELKVQVGDEDVEIKVKDLRNGTFDVTFVPNNVGTFPVKVTYMGKPVEGDGFSIDVAPKPDVTGVSALTGARVAKPFEIVLGTVNLKADQVEVKLVDSDGKAVTKYKLKEKGDSKIILTWTPTIPGEHTLDLVVDGHECVGLPAKFPVAPKPHATLVGDKKRKGVEGKVFEFQLNTVNLRPQDIRIEITDDKNEKIFREDALVGEKKEKKESAKTPRLMSPRETKRSKSRKDKGKDEDSSTPRDYSLPAIAVDEPGLKGLVVPGDIIVSPPQVSQNGDQFTISYVPWKTGKFDIKVTFEDVLVDLRVVASAKPKSKTVDTLDQLGLNAGFRNIGDEKELLKRIKKLREELIHGYNRNNQLQEKYKEVDKTISLLVRNHTSIVAIDRARKRKQQGNATSIAETSQATFHRNRNQMALYGNLFYLLRTEPHYLATLTNLTEQKHRNDMCQLIILTLFTNAFSPTQELMLLRLISTAVSYDIHGSATLEEFVDNSPSIHLIIYYNKRKEGRRFIKSIFQKPIQNLIEEDSFQGDNEKLRNWVENFYEIIMSAIDQLPYGIRYICNVIYKGLQEKFPKMEHINLLSAVGYVVFYRFLNLAFIGPEDWGLIDAGDVDAAHPFKLNCLQISKVLKSLFTDLKEIPDPSLKDLNPWVKSKLPDVQSFLKDVIDVSEPEDHLKVSKYSKLGDTDESILIPLKEIVLLHVECDSHKAELVKDKKAADKDPLMIILNELAEVPSGGAQDKTQITLPLRNKFEIQMSPVERDQNLKVQTINDLLYLFSEYTNINGENLLEIFLLMKHHATTVNPKPADAKLVEDVLANLETLAKVEGTKLSKKNGYNDFIEDIREELLAKEKHMNELRHEIKQLSEANDELDQQKKKISEATKAFDDYLQGVSNELRKNFKPTTRKFTWKQLTNKKCNIIYSSEIPDSQKKAIKFEITHSGPEEFRVKGKVAMISKDFKIKMTDLLDAKDSGETTYETDVGVTLDVNQTLIFLNSKFLNKKRKYTKAK
eukprot:TRINITY_DN6933_c0_g1_i1.p1 TRINITY_DN6933_c0_g1~~TRINITY_DN6933_c0_g1_i1.p1  ORF type:complete len:2573 (-),score=698.42 TRINITY_DN6933_c0_g1_i1:63-7781(-)